ncbi:CoB--CoM heterodisulfide reductase subunit B 2 [Planktothrix tepida]|uniref:Cysteine-rich domain protein n=2 Tax=Planktothrix TaxID=54304 RepID=A0A1J1LP54_9CYAN|nr:MULTISPECIES: CoB--CoM heterodisulfide reductase iron-sulfur subunit B family protein [Planktothrix]CAD5952754.1 CoB--CoM heterodisulfide reductase subunit B 2 [Planktothrix pseudagardhii]CAD5957793.1 CoB--CoM heterodisulfide reductase subunit B 2 [Planktothrix tepida]CUR34022.1 Cysteine-rich domain protein [Planktothrix tepida PCC 9214]
MKYSYYPGCSLHTTAREFDISTKVVMEELGIELKELQDWSCCGGSVAAGVSHDVGMAMAARNVVLAQKENLDLLTSCSGCYNKSARAAKALEDAAEKDRISVILSKMGLSISDYNIRVRNVVDVLANDIDITPHIKKPLTGLKVVCYYGCLLTRPADITGWDSPIVPMSMDKLSAICGAEVIDFSLKTKCCGGPILVSQQDIAFDLTKQLLDEAKFQGADCIVLACPLCDTNLELRQGEIEKKYNISYNLPILYITEIIGLALGIKPGKLGMNKHIVSPQPVLAKLGL